MSDQSAEILRGLYFLLRCLIFCTVEVSQNGRIVLQSMGRKVWVGHHPDENQLWVCDTKIVQFVPALLRERQTFDLNDPRAIGAAVRCTCRLLKQDVPSFYMIDQALQKGPPAWMLEDQPF